MDNAKAYVTMEELAQFKEVHQIVVPVTLQFRDAANEQVVLPAHEAPDGA